MQKIILLLCFVCTLQCVHAQKPGSLEDNSLQQTAAFVRGSQIIFQDDFENETAGSFPSKWNTNKSGEVKKLNGIEMANGPHIPTQCTLPTKPINKAEITINSIITL